ncbi:MAG TPA: alpha/beta hydrolase [Porticoccaceae bacterium]|nr:alpha/beta hydrolase [Porticoccaceae bacterium]
MIIDYSWIIILILATQFMESILHYLEYGASEGKIVIYFHGAPGSPEECSIFDQHAKEHGLNFICYDRFSTDSSLQGQAYYKHLASVIAGKINGKKIDIIGFSIGCQAAIETSLYLEDSVHELHLISPAAPLDAAKFSHDMAGGVVFSIARKHPFIFILLSYWQAFLAKVAPNILFKMLFASAAGKDKALSKTNEFKDFMSQVLKHCFVTNVNGYIREIKQYVTPWQDSVLKCSVKTQIWQGTHDNWSPVSMAKYLKGNMSNASSLQLMKDLSHYTCLYASAPSICSQLKKP